MYSDPYTMQISRFDADLHWQYERQKLRDHIATLPSSSFEKTKFDDDERFYATFPQARQAAIDHWIAGQFACAPWYDDGSEVYAAAPTPTLTRFTTYTLANALSPVPTAENDDILRRRRSGRNTRSCSRRSSIVPSNAPPRYTYTGDWEADAITAAEYLSLPISLPALPSLPQPCRRPRQRHHPYSPPPPAPKRPKILRDKNGKPIMACLFCRGRKIACGPPPKGSDDPTCNQCARRGLECQYPTINRRGMRKKKSTLVAYDEMFDLSSSSSKAFELAQINKMIAMEDFSGDSGSENADEDEDD